jgi:para-nitrobenzyl esterase
MMLRHTASGDVVGFLGKTGIYEWRGVPYAQPPVGNWRWRGPRAPVSWHGTRETLKYGSACLQPAADVLPLHGGRYGAVEYLRTAKYAGNEDCLYLNVQRPRPATDDSTQRPLPVMVWFHGGANITGSGEGYGTTEFFTNVKVVLVTANYRLGNFGFFTHPALRAELGSASDHSGNYGLLDQIQALKWVQKNVAAFGGDPHNVTIFGVSAGGADCMGLISSPAAAGLFQRAIVMSGHELTRSVEQASNPIDEPAPGLPAPSGELLLQRLILDGKVRDRAAAKAWAGKASAEQIAAYLRSKSYAEFDEAEAHIVEDKHTASGETLIRDGVIIPEAGIAASYATRHGHNRVSVMIGSVHDEDQGYVLSKAPYGEIIEGSQGPEYRFNDLQGYRLMSEYASRLWKAEDVDEPASALSRNQRGQIFAYRLDWKEVQPWPGPDHEPHGTIHGMDIPLLFGLPPSQSAPFDWFNFAVTPAGLSGYSSVSKAMMSYWAQFAYTGDPGRGAHGDLPRWSAWSNAPDTSKFMVIDSEAGGGLRMSSESLTKAHVLEQIAQDTRLTSRAQQCAFLKRLVEYSTMTPRLLPQDYSVFAGGVCTQ